MARPGADSTNLHDADLENSPVPIEPLLSRRPKPENSDDLRSFRVSLRWCALDHSSWIGKSVSYFAFVLFTILSPLAASVIARYRYDSVSDDPISFNKLVQLPASALASIGFFTLTRFFSQYSLGQLLFLDGLESDTSYVRSGYRRELDRSFRYLACILLPSFLVELTHKIVFFSKVTIIVPFVTSEIAAKTVVGALVLWSWVYRTSMFLLVCVLFRLTCELQILRFKGFGKLLEGCGSDASAIFNEHVRIRTQLSATSHRYRCFIIGSLVTITVSQFGALLLVLASKETKTFLNSGDLIVCSAVELSGFCLCLLGAAKITHRAQGIASVASRWHMIVTCAFSTSSSNSCDSDAESDRLIPVPSLYSPSSFQIRQALVAYLRNNSGGITVYGYALDRGLLHTLFAFEFSLVLWILSKVVVL